MTTLPRTLSSYATGSGADRWVNCPGSVALSIGLEQREEEYSSEGTRAHKLASDALLEGTPLAEISESPEAQNGGKPLDLDAVRYYVSFVRRYVPNEADVFVEERLKLLGGSGGVDCYYVKGKTAGIFDMKYGVGVPVEAKDNGQMAFYACAIKHLYPQVTNVTTHIIQPRIGERFADVPLFSAWTLRHGTLRKWYRKFEQAYKDIEEGALIKAGEWCQFCAGRPVCPAQLSLVRYRAKEALSNRSGDLTLKDLPEPTDQVAMSLVDHDEMIPRVAAVLALKGRFTAWLKKAEDYLYHQLTSGRSIPGFELVAKKSNRQWAPIYDETELTTELVALGVPAEDTYKPKKRISPAEVEKRVGKSKIVQEKLDKLTVKPSNGQRIRLVGDFESDIAELLEDDPDL
jgi:hypothetical protein